MPMLDPQPDSEATIRPLRTLVGDPLAAERQIARAYRLYSPVYDLIFGRVFHRGRVAAIRCAELEPGERVLDVGIGTGLNLPLYPSDCRIVGVDFSPGMLALARQRIDRLGLTAASVEEMDATRLDFADATFDKAIATYVVSAAPRPAEVLQEMRRVVRPGGTFVVLNHFRSPGRWRGQVEELLAPLCRRLGWKSDLELEPLLEQTGLRPELTHRMSIMGGLIDGLRLLRFRNGVAPAAPGRVSECC